MFRASRLRATSLRAFKCLFLAAALPVHGQPAGFVNELLPAPSRLQVTSGALPISPSFTVSTNAASNAALKAATHRMLDALEQQSNTPLSKVLQTIGSGTTMTITVAGTGPERPTLDTDESYTLDITGSTVSLKAATIFGALHGLVTFHQLLQPQNGVYVFPAVHIEDSPRFPWRGLMLDVGRHFMPLPVLYRTIDAMEAVKLNVLHLHLTEDQGFRIESKRFPRLTDMGSDGLFYTQDQIRDLINYATAHGIRIVPEFDVPGHVTSWLVGYPALASQPREYAIGRTFGIWDGALDPTRESTYEFLDGFIGEMAALFPDEYMHMGGDESNGKDWKANPSIAAYMQQHNIRSTDELQVYFSSRVLALVKKHGKQMVGWDEILQPTTPKDAIIQSWRGVASLATAARQGNRSILSAPYYLDAMKSTERMYLDDPVPDGSNLTPQQEQLILGGEVTMWAEQITPQTIDSRIWPRTAALAERFWSPRSIRNIDDLYRRLEAQSLRLDALGITHLSGPNRGLRQLAGSEEGASHLAVLTSTLTPASFGSRYKQQKTSQLTPMGNLVDFTRPDPALRHTLPLLVHSFLYSQGQEHQQARRKLDALFDSWIATGSAIDALAIDNPLLQQVKVRREQLPKLGLLGRQSLDLIDRKSMSDASWLAAQGMLLKEAAMPHDIVDFVILPPLQSLLDATQTH